MSTKMADVRAQVTAALCELEALFKPHCKLTFLMRNPEVGDGDLIVTSDDMEEIAAAIARLRRKPVVPPKITPDDIARWSAEEQQAKADARAMIEREMRR